MVDRINIPEFEVSEFNQALMEFGSIQCLPKNPKCHICIFKNNCFAFNNAFPCTYLGSRYATKVVLVVGFIMVSMFVCLLFC